MQQLDNVLEQVRGLWRFRWIGMSVAWVILVLEMIVIILIPDQYQASATVNVDTQTALSAATRSLTVDENTDSQIQRVREALLGGTQLSKIADETGLTARGATPQEREKVVGKLRKQIQITGGASGGPSAGGGYLRHFVFEQGSRDQPEGG